MWVAFLFLLLASVALILVGWWGFQEKLPRQHWAGIRTPYSLASDEQWAAVHRYGSPYLIFGGVAALATAAAALPFAIAGSLPAGFSATVLVAIVIVVVVSALMAWILGERAARSSAG
jgi:uncharacterized membrane protein